ncbi:hypothetical protein [Chloroflexus sp.]|uniref:hypothetical protein n=1 Tax=Chloroflexus sp. TaxID=1904827 RepID=UPI002ACD39A8|nr:hypothetical protein [Chloroflexus sp.]
MARPRAGQVWMMTIGADRETGPPASCPDLPDRRPVLGGIQHDRMRPIRPGRRGWWWLLGHVI